MNAPKPYTAARNLVPDSERYSGREKSSYIRELSPLKPEWDRDEATAADRLILALVEAGVDTFFGIPGGPVSPVFDAILRAPGARLIESRHETSAAFAAADYYHASGMIPAVVVTAGPGATNAVTGIVSAHLERVPMLVICGDVAWAASGQRLAQDSGPEGIDIEMLFAKAARRTVRVAQAQTAASQGIAALDAARNPHNPGPALLVIPIHNGRARAPQMQIDSPCVTAAATPSGSSVEHAALWLMEAKRPLIVFGAGARPHAPAMRQLADALNVPFVTTPQGKGVVSEEHPRSLRHGGLGASIWAREYTQKGVDVALVLGTDLDDSSIGPTPYVGKGGKLVHVDLNGSVFGRNFPTALGVVSDVGAYAKQLYELVMAQGLHHPGTRALMREARRNSPFEVADFRMDADPLITPYRAVADLEAAAGPSATFISDIGEHMLFALHYLTARRPDSFTIHLGLGSMGSGISGAIGLALGRRDRRVVCICGDGGMQMVGMESLVALKYRLPIVYAVFNDARYNMVYHGFKQVFGREAPWDTPWIDFAAWARSAGMAGIRVNHPGEITADLLDRVTEGGMPVVLDIRIDREKRIKGGGRNESLQQMSVAPAGAR